MLNTSPPPGHGRPSMAPFSSGSRVLTQIGYRGLFLPIYNPHPLIRSVAFKLAPPYVSVGRLEFLEGCPVLLKAVVSFSSP